MLEPTPEVLLSLARVAARGKRRAREVARFMLDVDRHVLALSRALHDHTYEPGRGRCFRITDPKPRPIYALPFRDRVAQHYHMAATLPAIERSLVSQTYACRPGKGTHRALRRAIELARTRRFVLRLDIQKFFASIDHALLRRTLGPTTPRELRWLRDRFIDAPLPEGAIEPVTFYVPGDELWTPFERPHGLPIGSLTSQIWANVYLSPIDQLLASHLGLPDFVRYCDDVLVFSDDRERLRDALHAVRERLHALRLRLHPRKSRLHGTSDPVDQEKPRPCHGRPSATASPALGFPIDEGLPLVLAQRNPTLLLRFVGWLSLLRFDGRKFCGLSLIHEPPRTMSSNGRATEVARGA